MTQAERQLYIKKHEKLLQMINNYKLTPEQEQHLRKMKQETQLEIAIRYLRSNQNKNYIFPLTCQEDEDFSEFPGRVSFQQTFYDLCSQNFLPERQKITKQGGSRRVKSLGSEKIQENKRNQMTQRAVQRGNLIRLKLPKIQSSKIAFKSLQKEIVPVIEQKKTFKIKPLSKIKKQTSSPQKDLNQYGMLLTKKLLTQEEQVIKIGITKVLVNKRIHSPVKSFNRNIKYV